MTDMEMIAIFILQIQDLATKIPKITTAPILIVAPVLAKVGIFY